MFGTFFFPPYLWQAVIAALSVELGTGEVFEMPMEQVRTVPDFEFLQE